MRARKKGGGGGEALMRRGEENSLKSSSETADDVGERDADVGVAEGGEKSQREIVRIDLIRGVLDREPEE